MSFDGKVVMVTGSGSGIGRAVARLFAQEGATVVIADANAEAHKSAAAEIGGKAIAISTDVTDSAQVQNLVNQVTTHFGRIDVLVNNAGFGFTSNVTSVPEADWDRLMSVNLKGVFLCSKYVIPIMERQGGGAIVNTCAYRKPYPSC